MTGWNFDVKSMCKICGRHRVFQDLEGTDPRLIKSESNLLLWRSATAKGTLLF
jgi:hypothetical protein